MEPGPSALLWEFCPIVLKENEGGASYTEQPLPALDFYSVATMRLTFIDYLDHLTLCCHEKHLSPILVDNEITNCCLTLKNT